MQANTNSTRARGGRLSRLLTGALLLALLLAVMSPAAAAAPAPAQSKGWTDIVDVLVGEDFTIGVRADGTVAFAGNDYDGAGKSISGWTDIERLELTGWENFVIGYKKDGGIALESLYDWQHSNSYGTHWLEREFMTWKNVTQFCLSDDFCLGLHEDGTVSYVTAYPDTRDALQAVQSWSDIKQLATDGFSLVVGLKNDGTVVSTDDELLSAEGGYWGSTWGPREGWKDVEELVYTGAGLYAIKKDGTVLGMQRAGWTDIDSLYVASDSVFGLRRNGTVATDFSDYVADDPRLKEVASWTNLVQLGFDLTGYARYVPVGLCADGTIRAVTKGSFNEPYGYWDFSGWSGVKQLYSGSEYTIGVRADGSVLVTGGEFDTLSYLDEIKGWTDIAAVYAPAGGGGADHLVGLKTDGTLVAAGNNAQGQCEVG